MTSGTIGTGGSPIRRRWTKPKAWLALLVIAGGGPPRPVRAGKARQGPVRDPFAIIDKKCRHMIVIIEFLVIIADDDQDVRPAGGEKGGKSGQRALRRGVTRREPVRDERVGDRRIGPREPLFEAHRPPFGVEQRPHPVALDETRPIRGRGVQHRRVRGGDSEDDVGHGRASLLPLPMRTRVGPGGETRQQRGRPGFAIFSARSCFYTLITARGSSTRSHA